MEKELRLLGVPPAEMSFWLPFANGEDVNEEELAAKRQDILPATWTALVIIRQKAKPI